ncbi:hypothetical protein WA026_003208 [Henosepilachna vigintioctopunctata]|uniref:C2HC/C3H-type domain-containing protein n=1 Tax=Henosepilachna vigintioctopunctata TaxID=420089 RepID=A0AAW1TMG7_9CUCU
MFHDQSANNSTKNRKLFKVETLMNVECYICGRKFGTNSIKIHETQCLKKWHLINDQLPKDMRPALPTRPEEKRTEDEKLDEPTASSIKEVNDSTSKKEPPLFPCYLCGKYFSVHEIYEHEPECLEIWKAENDKLPPHKRKRLPQKEDIKFTPSGGVDFEGTFNRIWENHLAELIPCRMCGRTFAPDRLEIHENACKGNNVRRKSDSKNKSSKSTK